MFYIVSICKKARQIERALHKNTINDDRSIRIIFCEESVMSVPSTVAQVIVSIIPIVGIVMGCTVVFFYLMWDYRLKKCMIENKIYEKRKFDLDTFALMSGLILFVLGSSLMTFFIIRDGLSYGALSGLIPSAIGLSMLMFFVIRVFTKTDK